MIYLNILTAYKPLIIDIKVNNKKRLGTAIPSQAKSPKPKRSL